MLPNVTLPDTHDWDTSWGNNFIKVKLDNGTTQKIVIGHNKRGDVMAMDAATGKPYQFNDFGAPTQTPLIPSGIIMALDKDTGKALWRHNFGAPIGIGGPSIGHGGTLLVTTGSPTEISSNTGGYIVAFALPAESSCLLMPCLTIYWSRH